MAFQKKTPVEKFRTKLNNLLYDDMVTEYKGAIKVRNKVLFRHNFKEVKYTKMRYFQRQKEDLVKDDFSVVIPLTEPNLALFSTTLVNPPRGARLIVDLFRKVIDNVFDEIVIGDSSNSIEDHRITVTKELYIIINNINREEGIDKKVRFKNRILPFLNSSFGFELEATEADRDYSLLLKEVIESGEITQQDIIEMTSNLETGNFNNIVIEKQVNKQVEWLIEVISDIVDTPKLDKKTAGELGNKHFGFAKSSISGPEHLMEKILTKYGRNSLFGVPVLLNTDKYVVHKRGLSRSQFDIVLVNHLCDLEVVELKRPDCFVLEYDESRAKFYASKDLAIAISQAERYISAVHKDNDEDYTIDGQKIKDYLNGQIGNSLTVEICRPKAIIIIGTFRTLAKDYATLRKNTKCKITIQEYNDNCWQAYKELKAAFRNIEILTYSELLETARARIETVYQ